MSIEVKVKLNKGAYEVLEKIAGETHTTVEKLIEELVVEALIEHGYLAAEP